MTVTSMVPQVASFRGQGGVEGWSCKIVFPGGHFLFTYSDTFSVVYIVSHSAQHHRQMNRQAGGQNDDNSQSYYVQYNRLKIKGC